MLFFWAMAFLAASPAIGLVAAPAKMRPKVSWGLDSGLTGEPSRQKQRFPPGTFCAGWRSSCTCRARVFSRTGVRALRPSAMAWSMVLPTGSWYLLVPLVLAPPQKMVP
jgi:hypothetical protein